MTGKRREERARGEAFADIVDGKREGKEVLCHSLSHRSDQLEKSVH
jgi:hypothetical protein